MRKEVSNRRQLQCKKEGKIIENEEITETWKEYFYELLNKLQTRK